MTLGGIYALCSLEEDTEEEEKTEKAGGGNSAQGPAFWDLFLGSFPGVRRGKLGVTQTQDTAGAIEMMLKASFPPFLPQAEPASDGAKPHQSTQTNMKIGGQPMPQYQGHQDKS